jgi:hypothetical protein
MNSNSKQAVLRLNIVGYRRCQCVVQNIIGYRQGLALEWPCAGPKRNRIDIRISMDTYSIIVTNTMRLTCHGIPLVANECSCSKYAVNNVTGRAIPIFVAYQYLVYHRNYSNADSKKCYGIVPSPEVEVTFNFRTNNN